MRSQRSILALKYTPVSVVGGVRRAVGGFLRYVQYRDQHLEPGEGHVIDSYLRYMAHRDRTSPGGRIFGRDGVCSSSDRRHFVEYVARSTRGLQPRWVTAKDGKREDRQRAVYTFILSPEDWRGLDLRRIAGVAMRQLESDAGSGGIGPWFAAEHRNTAHHHVHVILAARSEVEPGRFHTFAITRPRLQRMKEAIAQEIERQRSRDLSPRLERDSVVEAKRPSTEMAHVLAHRSTTRMRWILVRKLRPVGRRLHARQSSRRVSGPTLVWLKAIARRYSDRMELELERDNDRAEREGWVR